MKKILPYLLAMLIANSALAGTAYRYSDSVTTLRGDAVGGASVYVYQANTTTKVTLYSGPHSAYPVSSNPTSTDGYGRFSFYVEPGTYDMYVYGTNIVPYTMQDVRVFSDAGYTFNVLDYGAVPNDGEDDTAGIQAAINAAQSAGRGVVDITDGHFNVEELTITGDNVQVVGHGPASRIYGSSASVKETIYVTGDSCSIRGITFVGQADSTKSQSMAIKAESCNRLTIESCLFTSESPTLGYNWHIFVEQCSGVEILNNVMYGVKGTTDNGYGMVVASCDGVRISGNVGNMGPTQGRHHVYLSSGTRNAIVNGNRFYGGMSAMITSYTTAAQDSSVNCTISSNILQEAGDVTGSAGAIEVVGKARKYLISNNQIISAESHGIKIECGDTNSIYDVSVVGNRIDGCGKNGIYDLGASGVLISGNSIIGAGTAGSSQGIRVTTSYSDPTYSSVVGNIIRGGDYQYGISVESGTVAVSANVIEPGTLGSLYFIGASPAGDEYEGGTFRYAPIASAPDTTGARGKVWYDSVNDKLKVYNGSGWQALH